MSKIIISCAVTGSIHTPSMSPYLPVTAEAIAEQAIGAAEAGAAILHLHARDPADRASIGRVRALHGIFASDQGRNRCGGESHHRRQCGDDAWSSGWPGR
jgi:uncharacterized protein (DUF849 family)